MLEGWLAIWNLKIRQNKMTKTVHIVGGGLAGSEAVWQCLNQGHKVFFMK